MRVQVTNLIAKLPNPISQRQPCVTELLDYSATGDYTAEDTSTKRRLHYGYTMGVAVPVTVLCDLIKYAVARPERVAYTVVTVGLFVLGIWLLLVL